MMCFCIIINFSLCITIPSCQTISSWSSSLQFFLQEEVSYLMLQYKIDMCSLLDHAKLISKSYHIQNCLRAFSKYYPLFIYEPDLLYCRCVISGTGKIALHVLEKLLSCGAIPITVSGNVLSLQTTRLFMQTFVNCWSTDCLANWFFMSLTFRLCRISLHFCQATCSW